MKRIISVLLASVVLAACALAFSGCGCNKSQSGESDIKNLNGYVMPTTQPDLKDDNFGFYIINSDELMLTRYYGSDTNVTIPETFRDYKVTIIGHSVFHTSKIESVVIPDSITEIQDYAFASNTHLTSVTLSKNLKVLGTNVFFNCTKLTSIELPATLKKIDAFTFCGAGLTSITVPESKTFTSLSQYMFFQCPNLKEVTLPATITDIPDNCFEQCPSDMVIKAYSDSYALSFAKNHNLKYEEISR